MATPVATYAPDLSLPSAPRVRRTSPRDGRPVGSFFPRVLCRVAGAPVEAMEGLRAPESLRLVEALRDVAAGREEARAILAPALFDSVAACDEPKVRRRMLRLKRDVHNLRPPRMADVAAAEPALDVDVVHRLRSYVSASRRVETLEQELAATLAVETRRARTAFSHLLADPGFLKGLLISSGSLFAALPKYRGATRSGRLTGRLEKTERGLLRYYARMTMKATPFGTLCSVIPGTLHTAGWDEESVGPRLALVGDPRPTESRVRLNKGLYGLLLAHLASRGGVRRRLDVELNPTLSREGERLLFLSASRGPEVFQRLQSNGVVDLIRAVVQRRGRLPLGELIAELEGHVAIDADAEEIGRYLDGLLDLGFLRLAVGIREQDPDWDVAFRDILIAIPDEHALAVAGLLSTLREKLEVYEVADVDARRRVLRAMEASVDDTFAALEIARRPPQALLLYEDATSAARLDLNLGARHSRTLDELEEFIRLTLPVAWPRADRATMRHFFENHYGDTGSGIPLLRFYEDYYREHFKAHLEREPKPGTGAAPDQEQGFKWGNPFGLDVIDRIDEAVERIRRVLSRKWAHAPTAESIHLTRRDLERALVGVDPLPRTPVSTAVFCQLAPSHEGGDGGLVAVIHRGSYTAGYGKYFSRFLYLLPDDFTAAVRENNEALDDGLLAEICGDAQFNANLHPPLLPWEISYPTGESGAAAAQLRSADLVVDRDPDDRHALCIVHRESRRVVRPMDLGFLNPRMRPALYQLLSHLGPASYFRTPLPVSVRPPADTPTGDAVEPPPGSSAPAGERTGPQVVHRPRICYGANVVLARRQWRVSGSLLPQREEDEAAAAFFCRLNRWRMEHGIPEEAYVRIEPIRTPGPKEPAAPEDGAPDPESDGPVGAAAPGVEDGVDEAVGDALPGGTVRDAHGPPPTRGSRDLQKPQYMDFGNPLLVGLFGRIAVNVPAYHAVFEERYPPAAGLPGDGHHRFANELILQLDFPGDTTSPSAQEATRA